VTEGYTSEYGLVPVLVLVALAYLLAVILSRSTRFVAEYVLVSARFKAAREVMKDFFHHVIHLSLDFFHQRKIGDLTARVGGDIYAMAAAIFRVVSVVITALPLFLFYWTLLFLTSWPLTLGALLIMGAKTLVANFFGRKIQHNIVRIGSAGGENNAKLTEVVGLITVIKAFCKEAHEHKAVGKIFTHHTELRRQRYTLDNLNTAIQAVLQSVAVVAVATLGAVMLLKDMIEPAPLMVYFFAANRSQEPTRQLISFLMALHTMRGLAVRILEIYRERSTVEDGPRTAGGFASTIEFKDVTFAYQGGDAAVRGINLTLRKGEVLAVVGPSGGGKSTLLGLLLRLQDPTSGAIYLDGTDVRQFTQQSYRRLFGLVTQDPLLFNATIRDNIAYADTGAVTDENVTRAARIAHVDEFTDQMDDGLDTFIGDRGVRLSGGQKQRVTLARAILRNPPILVLDEATSSLDSHSERLIQDSIDRFLEGRTAVIVAHRLSTIHRADRIVVISGGRIVEEGNHETLLARRGTYFELHRAQSVDQETA
jgi:subfamily B ATP-binding cassette protein MsbA